MLIIAVIAARVSFAGDDLVPGVIHTDGSFEHIGAVWEIAGDDDLDSSMTRLRDSRKAELAALCDPAVKGALRANGVQLIHYGHLRRGQQT